MNKELAAKLLRTPKIASLIIGAATGTVPEELRPVDIPECCKPEPQIGCDVVLYQDTSGCMYGLGRFPSDPCWFGSAYIIGDTMAMLGGCYSIHGKRPVVAISDGEPEAALASYNGLTLHIEPLEIPVQGQVALNEMTSLLCGEEIEPVTELGMKVKEVKNGREVH